MVAKELSKALGQCSEKIISAIENDNEIAIVTCLGADGLVSGGIISLALARLEARYTVRTVPELTSEVIGELGSAGHDFYIVCDLGTHMTNELFDMLGDRWLLLDHKIPNAKIKGEKHRDLMFNVWNYDSDGEKEISSGGIAYLIAVALEKKNNDLCTLALVSALAERQDLGEKRSLIGINSEIANTAKSLGLITIETGLMLSGRKNEPIHEAIASTSFPYIEGLTWNFGNSYSLVKNSGLNMKDKNGRWRILSEISEEEKGLIIDSISKFVARSKNQVTSLPDDLTGYTYTLCEEDPQTSLEDAREFAEMLNSCATANKAGVGIGICVGDRHKSLDEGEEIFSTYKHTLRNFVSAILSERWRLIDNGKVVFVNGDGMVDAAMLDAISLLLSRSTAFTGRIILVRTIPKDSSEYRFSAKKCCGCKSASNLGVVIKNCSEAIGGAGDGESSSASCRIPAINLEQFMTIVRSALDNTEHETE